MKTVFKRFVIILSAFIAVVFGLIFIVLGLFEDQIGEKVISAANEQLKTTLEVDGFELSIFRSFPYVGANLKGVEINDTDNQLLLMVEEISFRASLFSLFREKIEIKSVAIKDGRIYLAYDKNGKNNFDILKGAESPEDSSGIIDLQSAVLKNIEIDYQDHQQNNKLLLYVEKASFSGAFASEKFQLISKADLEVALLEIEKDRLMKDVTVEYELEIEVNTKKGIYVFENFNLQLAELPLVVKGKIEQREKGQYVDVELESDGGQLSDLLHLLPAEQKKLMEGIESRGVFGVKANVLGLYSHNDMPEINVGLNFDNGKITGDRIRSSVRDLSFSAQYSNGDKKSAKTSSLKINNFAGQFEREAFSFDLDIYNFDNPKIDFSADGKLTVGALLPFIPNIGITDGGGYIFIDDLKLKGKLNDMKRASRVPNVFLSGAISLDKAFLTINEEDIYLNQGQIALKGNDVTINNLELKAPGTELVFNGKAINLLPVMFADSTNSKVAEFIFQANLNARQLDIDQLLAFGMPAEQTIAKAEEAGKSDSLASVEVAKRTYYSQFLNGTFIAEIAEFNYNKIKGTNFEGKLVFDEKIMNITGKTQAMGGDFELDADLFFGKKPYLEAKISCNQIEANTFFEQAENFGQDLLTDENLEGIMDARFFVKSFWDKKGEFLQKDLHILGGMGIHNGVLKDLTMLEDFSSFVDIRDLREIRFASLENFFEIKDNTFHLPVMFIQSNALNLTISGQHTIEQDIAYSLKVNAGQVMINKFKRHDTALNPKAARRNGFFNLYYAILGNLDNYTFSSNKNRVQRDFEESELRKRDIHFALEKALGTVIEFVEEPLDWRDIPEYEEDPDSTEPEFLDMDIEGGKN